MFPMIDYAVQQLEKRLNDRDEKHRLERERMLALAKASLQQSTSSQPGAAPHSAHSHSA